MTRFVLLASLFVATPAFADCPDDCDGDGHAAIALGGDDCDDGDANRYPGNFEICDSLGHDEDCDPTTLGATDADGDGFVSGACCNTQPSGSLTCGPDCDDATFTTNPRAGESCNLVDDDCDGFVDEGLTTSWYVDGDGDGYGADGAPLETCLTEPGFTTRLGDCDDGDVAVQPGTQVCNGDGTVSVCQPDGTFAAAACPSGTACVDQPNGLGLCAFQLPGRGPR